MSLGPFAALPSLAATGMTPTNGTSALSTLAQGAESLFAQAQPPTKTGGSGGGIFGGDFLLRAVTLLLGLLLIAAGLFSHPAVREKIVEAGKVAAAAA